MIRTMRHAGTFAVCAALAACLSPAVSATRSSSPTIVELHLDGEVNPVMAEYIDGGIDQANRQGASLVLITMDTPGGLDTSMRAIIQHIIASPAPVAVYVAPAGSRGASAGFFILLSADVAAMAPGTHAGAASPVAEVGGYPVTLDDTLAKKILNDATAYLRSYASRRGRNVALAETAITGAKAFTEREALDGHLIDLVASSPDDLLSRLDGRTITRLDGSTSTLALAHAEVVTVDMSARQRFLARIVEPDVFLILLLVGVLGLYVEFTHPGLVAPGVIGGIALVLALFAMELLPINLTGLLLILLALALFALEAMYTNHGVLAAGGVVAMILGALMLVRSPLTGGGVSLGVAIGAVLPFAIITVVLAQVVLRSRRLAPQTGVDELLREIGRVTEPIGGGAASAPGMVLVRGELWRAAASRPIAAGARVRIAGVEGLTVRVEPVDNVADRAPIEERHTHA